MAQKAKMLAAKLDNLTWISRSPMLVKRKLTPQVVLCPPHVYHGVCVCARTRVCNHVHVPPIKVKNLKIFKKADDT